MNPLRANFTELYERHLCRHSQFGINVIHLISLVGTYWALYSFAYGLFESVWLPTGLAASYLAVLACNLPIRVFLVTVAFLGIFFALLSSLPLLPVWVYPLTLYPFYKIQAWSHWICDRAFDMTEFDKKYPKGFARFCAFWRSCLPPSGWS